jgi:predicted phosphate transport protein (TIGR00153 family)
MKLDKFFQILVPKDKKFYPLFCQASANLVECTKSFKELLNTNEEEKRNELVKKIKKLEKAGDKITTTIFDELNSTFITPFDREDIHKLTSRIDTVVDLINTSARRLQMYRLFDIPPVFHQMAELLFRSAGEIIALWFILIIQQLLKSLR